MTMECLYTTTTWDECPECGQDGCQFTDEPREYQLVTECPHCGFECVDGYEDIYGCMAVPWGFLL